MLERRAKRMGSGSRYSTSKMAVVGDDTKQLIKDAVDAELLLKALGFSVSGSNGSDVRAPCIIHGGDNTTGFSMRLDTKTWRCFTRQCEQNSLGSAQNDLFALVMKVRNVPFMESVKYLATFAGLNLDLENMFVEQTPESRRRRDTSSYIRSISKLTKRHQKLDSLSEDVVSAYISQRTDYFLQFGFTPETLATFEIGAMFDSEGVHRATVPIRDSAGRLVSLSGRRTDGDEEPRYRLGYKFQKGSVLYNLHRALQTGSSTIIIVEGFKACWAVHEAGLPNVAACMGAQITDEQVLQLAGTGFRNCLVMFDGDKAGYKGAATAEVKLSKAFNTQVLSLPEKISPDSLSRVELRDLVDMYLYSF
jgi:DNA primase